MSSPGAGGQTNGGRRALEGVLPLEWLSHLAWREANSRRAVYQVHKYWARRPGALFRALILGALLPEGADLERAYWQPPDLAGALVLDPFMGGGTTVVEALRLGCRAVGVDVNPLSWFITAGSLTPVDPAELAAAAAELAAHPGAAIRERYRTACPGCGGAADTVYAFWVRQAPCGGCGAPVDLFASYRLGPRGAWAVCPGCSSVFPAGPGPAVCPACARAFDPAVGSTRQGAYTCGACGRPGRSRDAAGTGGGPLPLRLYAVEYACPGCGARAYKDPDAGDHARVAAAAAELAARRHTLPLPAGPVPDGVKTRDLLRHGYRTWDSLFGPRQLLSLGELWAAVLARAPGPLRDLLLLTCSDSLNANNLLCKYNRPAGKLEPLFGLHAYHIVDQPVEGNVWGAAAGRGSFRRYLEKARRAQEYLRRPAGPAPAPLAARMAPDYGALAAGAGNLVLRCASATDLGFLPDLSVDAVITDPPYFDNVQYGELSHFFYAWLQAALGPAVPAFRAPRPGGEQELVVARGRRGRDFFARGLARVFAECHRVLRDDGLLVFTFHHRRPAAWAAAVGALVAAGFRVVATHPVRAEGRSGLHSDAGNIKVDLPMVCRKRQGPLPPVAWPDLLAGLRERAAAALAAAPGLSPADGAVVALGRMLELYTRYAPPVPVEQALAAMAATVAGLQRQP